jgi:hypothetical protein
VEVYTQARVAGCIQARAAEPILVQVVECTLALEVVYIAVQAAECTLAPAITLIEATYHLGLYLLNILRDVRCKR